MQLLLCAATPFEIAPAVQFLQTYNKHADNRIDVLVTGVGLLPATFNLTRQVLLNQPQFILQAGVAGSINDALSLGEVVVVNQESVGDAGVYENGIFSTLFDMALAEKNTHPWTNGQLVNEGITSLHLTGMKVVAGVTVNEITTNAERIAYYQQSGAQVETLEGAALHYVGLMTGIPFLQIRSISNYVGERNKSKWQMKEAITNLNDELQRIFIKLLKV